jgi:hypothetical protein
VKVWQQHKVQHVSIEHDVLVPLVHLRRQQLALVSRRTQITFSTAAGQTERVSNKHELLIHTG